MEKPEIWKDIKTKEWEQILNENDEYNKMRKPEIQDDPNLDEKYDKLKGNMQNNLMRFVTDKIIDDEAKDIKIERERAATIIKNLNSKQRVFN